MEKFNLLSVDKKEDGVWLTFNTKKGLQASLNVELIADKFGSIVSETLKQWAKEIREEK